MPFQPTPELEHKLLCDLSDEQRTVSDVAGSNGIPLADFITWLASDRTQQRITEIERAFTARIRLAALGNLNFALRAAVDTISTQQKDHLAREPFSLAERRERRQLQESARRAGNFIYRLTQLPLPEGGGRGVGRSPLGLPLPEGGGRGKGDEAPTQPQHTSVPNSPSLRVGEGRGVGKGKDRLPLPEGGGGGKGDETLAQPQHTSVRIVREEVPKGDEAPTQPQHTSVQIALEEPAEAATNLLLSTAQPPRRPKSTENRSSGQRPLDTSPLPPTEALTYHSP